MTTFDNSLYADLNTGGVLGGVIASLPALGMIAASSNVEPHGTLLFVSTYVGAMAGHVTQCIMSTSTVSHSTHDRM